MITDGDPLPGARPRRYVVITNSAGPEKADHDGLSGEPNALKHFGYSRLGQRSLVVPGPRFQRAQRGPVGSEMYCPQERRQLSVDGHRREIEILCIRRVVHVRVPVRKCPLMSPSVRPSAQRWSRSSCAYFRLSPVSLDPSTALPDTRPARLSESHRRSDQAYHLDPYAGQTARNSCGAGEHHLQKKDPCHGYRDLHRSLANLLVHAMRIRLLRRTLRAQATNSR